MLLKWLTSFRDDSERNALPYSATLAPMTIAKAPPPPNEAEISHAQDVLVLCAKMRSRILDNFNLVNFVTDNAWRCEFTDPVTAADFIKASNGYQSDLDVVADCAALAMRDVSGAKTTADYARERGIVFPQGFVPSPMPVFKSGQAIPLAAPNFVGMAVDAAAALAERFGVTLAYSENILRLSNITGADGVTRVYTDDVIKITSQAPQAGDKLPSDNTIAVEGNV
jgi:hypothetical protein